MPVHILAEHRDKQVSISIDGSVQITPPAAGLDAGFIQVPGDPRSIPVLAAKPIAD
jgi:hypothetical protein